MRNQLPLENIKVIDLSSFAAVSSTGRLLADWGADVIKVESLRGDAWTVSYTHLTLPTIA